MVVMKLGQKLKVDKWILCLLIVLCFFPRTVLAERQFNKEQMDQYLISLAVNNKAMLSLVFYEKGKITYSNQVGFASIEKHKLSVDKKIAANEKTQYKIGSITKIFTSTLIFQLIEQGKLDLSTRLSMFYPEIPNAEKITIAHLLSHRSGIFNYTNDPDFYNYYNKYQSKRDMIDRISDFNIQFEPGSMHEYSNSNYMLLGFIIEKVTGKSYEENFQANINDKLGLENTEYCSGDKTCSNKSESFYFYDDKWIKVNEWSMSLAQGAGSIISTPQDLTLFIHALFNGELVSEKSLALMKGTSNQNSKGLFQLPFYGNYSYGHTGFIEGFHSDLSYFELDDIAIAVNVNALNINFNDFMLAVLSIYYDRPFEMSDFGRKPVGIEVDKLRKYEGAFSSATSPLDIKLVVSRNVLTGQATGQDPFPLEAYSAYEFEYKPAGILVRFGSTENGDVDYSQFTLYQANWVIVYQK